MRVFIAFYCLSILIQPVLAQQSPDTQTVTIGPWTIATTYQADTFENCTMTRPANGLGVVFMRNQEGLLLSLDSPEWKLERGKAYSISLSAGQRSVEAKALAESKSVTIALADTAFNERLRTANVLEVHGAGATLHVPLDGSTAGLERLDMCFEKNVRQSPESNPFVAPAKRP
jgi:hypothetical protein